MQSFTHVEEGHFFTEMLDVVNYSDIVNFIFSKRLWKWEKKTFFEFKWVLGHVETWKFNFKFIVIRHFIL